MKGNQMTQILNIKEAAALTPFSIRTLRRAMRAGELKYMQRGRSCKIAIKTAWLDEWLERKAIEPTR